MGCLLKAGGGLYSRLVVSAVLLAAGSGSRMGHRPKSLLELGGVPLIRRQLIALSGAGVDELVVVLGHYAERIAHAVENFPVTLVHNPAPDDGQMSSLQAGLRAVSPRTDAVMVVLADQPLLHAQDMTDLISAYKQRPRGTHMVQPDVGGQPGNPVIFSTDMRERILTSNRPLGCRQWLAQHPDQVHRWATSNPRYRTDIDTLEDIDTLAQRTGHQLRWPADLATTR